MLELEPEEICCSRLVASPPAAHVVAATEAWRRGGGEEEERSRRGGGEEEERRRRGWWHLVDKELEFESLIMPGARLVESVLAHLAWHATGPYYGTWGGGGGGDRGE